MENLKLILIFFLMIFTLGCKKENTNRSILETKQAEELLTPLKDSIQVADRLILGKNYAEKELLNALKGSDQPNGIDFKNPILKDSLTAISVVEPILFDIYGKADIIDQRPYEVYHIDNYWVIEGTLPKGSVGGTFLVIIDDRNSRIIKLIHYE